MRAVVRAGGGVLAAAALLLCGCGSSDDGPKPGQTSLTVYSSLPLQGLQRLRSESIVNAEKLALSEAGGQVGPFTVKYVSLDDSRAAKGRWDPGTVLSNARKAVEDRTTIAYLGEADSGASAIAIPVLNEAGILTVSPVSTYPGLTTAQDADKGEPEKYYPSGTRTFARMVPADDRQARTIVTLMRAQACRRLFVVADRDVYGRGLATAVGRAALTRGITLVGESSLPVDETDVSDVAKDVTKAAPDCVFTGMTHTDHALTLYDAVHRAAPAAKLFGPDALAEPALAAALMPAVAARTYLVSIAPDPGRDRAAAHRFESAYTERYGRPPESDAIYGYEAMRAVLAAIAAAATHGNQRSKVLAAFFASGPRSSLLGTYKVRSDGDVDVGRYQLDRVRDGKLSFAGLLDG